MPGDGIGPEIMTEAQRVLEAVGQRFGLRFAFEDEPVGGRAIEAFGVALRESALPRAREADAVLFGAVGDPRFDDPKASVRPEQAILGLRRGLGLFANLRPVVAHGRLVGSSPLRPELLEGVDILFVRELTGGIYFGERERGSDERGRFARDTMRYDEHEVRRIVELAFEAAKGRRGKLTSVDKANVLDSSRLWREVTTEVAADYPEVELEHALVDSFAMHVLKRPRDFDVVVTGNMFGDILSDEASVLPGSLGVMPSASLGTARGDRTRVGLYEPIHGSAPDIAGQGIANPLGMILSAASMLRHSLGLDTEAQAIERAVASTIEAGAVTPDLGGEAMTEEVGSQVAGRVLEL
jgi:3-isopropylmalate dehydrogenase